MPDNPGMKMLICSDGSAQAEQAIKLGAWIAAGCMAEVTLFGIIEAHADSKAILDSLTRSQLALAEKKIQVEMVTKTGEPLTEIIRKTEETPFDLVVIGAVRKDTRGAFWMSSKSYKIIKEIKPPVMIVSGKTASIKRMLICSGGKRYINNAVRLAGAIARGVGAPVTLLHVMPELPVLYANLSEAQESAERLLNSHSELGLNLKGAKDTLESIGVKTEVHLRQGGVLEEILREIYDGGYDLVVTGSALSRSLRTYVLGDISREIVNRISCAVLVVRSQDKPVHSRFSLKGILERLSG